MNQEVRFGPGAVQLLRDVLRGLSPQKILLVAGKKSFELSGAQKALPPILKDFHVVRFDGLSGIPKVQDVDEGVRRFRQEGCSLVLGVGGGMVLDIAKAVALAATQESDAAGLLREQHRIRNRTVPSVMVPTTAGTGSEATPFCVLYQDKVKRSLDHPSLLPDAAILDPDLTRSMTPYVTACTGFDALSQAMESYWSVRSTDVSSAWAKETVGLALSALRKAVLSPDDQARQDMLWASHVAGKAIAVTRTTAPHAASYVLTARYGVPHGHAVALSLPHFLEFNARATRDAVQDPRGAAFLENRMKKICGMLHAASEQEAKAGLLRLMEEAGLATRLSHWNIGPKDMELLVGGADPARMGNNPRRVAPSDLRRIWQAAL